MPRRTVTVAKESPSRPRKRAGSLAEDRKSVTQAPSKERRWLSNDVLAKLPPSCPLRAPGALEAYRVAVRAGSELSLQSQAFLRPKGPDEVGAWLRTVLDQSRVVFQPWSMEILFVAGVLGSVRFSELEAMTGASSRTLATKLRLLCGAGLLERRVEAGPPTRISYALSKHGRATAALASPLFAHLNLAAVHAAAR